MSSFEKATVKWNIPETSESVRSSTLWSSHSYGDSNSSVVNYTDSFVEATQMQAYSDDFVSESHETNSDTFISTTIHFSDQNGKTDGNNAVSENIVTMLSHSDKDTVPTVTENVETVIEAHLSVRSETIQTAIDTQFSQALETAIEIHISEAGETTFVETAYDNSDIYSDTFETESLRSRMEDTDCDAYSQSSSLTHSYDGPDSYSQTGRGQTTDSEYSQDQDHEGQSKWSYTESTSPTTSSSYREIRDPLLESDDDLDLSDNYSDTFEQTELTSQVYLVDPEEIRKEEEIQKKTEESRKMFINNLVSKLKTSPVKTKTVTISLLKKEEKPDPRTVHFCKKKLKLLRQKKLTTREVTHTDVYHPLMKPGTRLEEYGVSKSILERAKLRNIMTAMETAANEKIHDPRRCPECRVKKAELDAVEAKRLFLRSRAKTLENKMMDARVEDHILKMNSVSMIAEIARDLPRHSEKPEKIFDKLFEPLLGTNVMR